MDNYGHLPWAELETKLDALYHEYASDMRGDNGTGKTEATRTGFFGSIAGNDAGAAPAVGRLEGKGAEAPVQSKPTKTTVKKSRAPAKVNLLGREFAAKDVASAEAVWNAANPDVVRFENLTDEQKYRLVDSVQEDEASRKDINDQIVGEISDTSGAKFSETSADKLNRETTTWKGVVSDFLSRALDRTKTYVLLSSTPGAMQAIGMPNLPVRIGIHALDYANVRLTREQMDDLPRQMAQPRAIYVHESQNGPSINFVTEYGNASGAIVIALRPNQHVGESGDAHFVVTILNVPTGRVVSEIRNGKGLYVDGNDALPGLRAAVSVAQKENRSKLSELRELMSRNFGFAPNGKRLLYRSDAVNQVSRGAAQYSESIATPTSASDIKSALRNIFLNPSRFDSLVTVVSSTDELTGEAAQHLSQAKDPTRVQAFVTPKGKVVMIAGNIPQGKELAVFLHEVGVHIGMKNLVGSANMTKLVGQVREWANKEDGSRESRLAQKALERAGDSSSKSDEELLAYFVEEAVLDGVNPTGINEASKLGQWFRTFWAAAKTALRKMGFQRFDKLNAQDLVNLAFGAAHLEISNERGNTDASDRPGAESVGGEPERTVDNTGTAEVSGDRGSAGSSLGASVHDEPETLRAKFSESTIDKTVAKLPAGVQESAYVTAHNLVDMVKKGIRGIAFGDQLASLIEDNLPSAKKFFALSGQRGAELTHLEAKVEQILERAHEAKDIDALNEFINRSTREQKWGYKPTEDSKVEVDPALKKMFDALSPEAQRAAKEVFAHGHEMIKSLNALVQEELSTGYDTEGMSKDEIAKLEKKKLRTLALFKKTFNALQGPYAPLVRVGSYVTVAKSQAYLDAVANDDDAAIEKLQSDPAHYVVEFSDSLGEAKALEKKLNATGQYAETRAHAKEAEYNRSNETPWAALRRVRQMIDADSGTSTKERQAARAMRNMLNDLFFSTLAEGSARQFQQKRRYVSGESKDMLRAFALKGRADAHFMTSLKYGKPMLDAISTMRAEAKQGDNSDDRVRDLNEVLTRYALSMDYRPEPALAKVQGLTSFWMLVTNPAYYLQNATQPLLMTVPWLAGKHGYAEANAALFKAYGDLTKGKLGIEKMPITKAEREALYALRDAGILDIGIQRELGYWANTDNKGLNLVANVQHFFGRQIQRLETINRVSSALAALRLSGGDVEYAANAVRVTHGDYSQFNEPRFFTQMPAGRLLLQFRKFQLIQLTMLTKLIHDSFKGGAEEAAVARKTLAILLGHYAVVAGGLGLPAMSLIGSLIASALGDPGDPKDEEYLLRKAIGNKELSDLLLRGVPAFLGVNMSQRLGAQNIMSLTPFTSKDPMTKEGFQELAIALLGPWAGLGSRVADGVGLVMKGDAYKGLELMVPSGLTSAMRAYRFATEGVTQRNHDIVLSPSEISFAETLVQSLGLPPMQLSERQRNSALMYEMKDAFHSTAAQLKLEYADAAKTGSSRSEIVDKWNALQDAERRNGFRPTPLGELYKAPSQQQRREHNVVGGLEFSRNNEQAARTLGEI